MKKGRKHQQGTGARVNGNAQQHGGKLNQSVLNHYQIADNLPI